jgi:protein ImuA
LHEVFASRPGDGAAASGFGLALALRAGGRDRTIVWVRQDMVTLEDGELNPTGLLAFGGDPAAVLLVRVRDALAALRAGNEALRCAALGAVLIELWGAPKSLDLTASRRLARAAAQSGIGAFLLRSHAAPQPSAATSRWSVRALASVPLEANAPGAPRFAIDLLRHRAGFPPRRWCVEWDRDQLAFRQTTLSRPVASLVADRSPAPAAGTPRVSGTEWRRAG